MVRRRQCDAVPNMVSASGRSDRKDVRSVHEPKLHAGNGTPVAMCERNLPAEIAQPRRGDLSQPRPTAWVSRGPILTLSPVKGEIRSPRSVPDVTLVVFNPVALK